MVRNFGGTQDDDGTMFNTSAYMLVYIREDCQSRKTKDGDRKTNNHISNDLDDVLCDISFEHIPEALLKRFEHEK